MVHWPNSPNDISMVELADFVCNIWLDDLMNSSNSIVISSLVDCGIDHSLPNFEEFPYIIQAVNVCKIHQRYLDGQLA